MTLIPVENPIEAGGDDPGPVGGDWLPAVVAAIGGGHFADVLLTAVHQSFGVDHLVVFTFTQNGRAGTLATIGRIPSRPADRLARDYAEADWFRRDPHLPRILAADARPLPIYAPVSYRLYGREYRKRFFEAVDIVDKVAFSVRAPDGCVLYANFHRLVDTGRFDAIARTTLLQYSAMLGAALGRHRQLAAGARCLDAPGPAFTILTPREREVCSGILAGMTSEAIAYTLGVTPNTVLTLRRRAYARLGIVSQNQLVRLSLRYR